MIRSDFKRPTRSSRAAARARPGLGPAGGQRQAATQGRRVLACATATAALLVGLNALVQTVNVIAAWWRHT